MKPELARVSLGARSKDALDETHEAKRLEIRAVRTQSLREERGVTQ